jgi:predicted phosphoadenosine phosphosulfate sulfurtransferase
MTQNFLSSTVYDAALKRINFVYDHCDDVIVSMSGGKDSTVLFELTRRVAAERGRLPLKVFWLDQEAEWKATERYMAQVMREPDVRPFWFQIPFRLSNSLSFSNNFLNCWAEADRAKWIREQDEISIKVNPIPAYDRFHDLIARLPSQCDLVGHKHVAVLVGMRATESSTRRLIMTESEGKFKGVTWCRKKTIGGTRVFWPIYDWLDRDVWTAIGTEGWAYNRIYDTLYKYGKTGRDMRVSALIHETAWHSIEELQESEPEMYNRYLGRVEGVNCFSHFKRDIMPDKLPPYFQSWREYRDYLLENLTEPEHRERFRNRWAGKGQQDQDRWYKVHVKEILINDLDGTLNTNARTRFKMADRSAPGGRYELAKEARRLAAEPTT